MRLLGTATIEAGAVRVSLVVGALVLTRRMWRETSMLSRQWSLATPTLATLRQRARSRRVRSRY